MDLVSALAEVKKISKLNKGVVHYIILNEDEYEVKDYKTVGEKDDIYSSWRDGKKLQDYALDKQIEEQEQIKTENKMETKVKSTTKKTTAPKKAAQPRKAATSDMKKVGASFFFDKEQWKKVEAIMKKEELTFNGWANQLVFSKLK